MESPSDDYPEEIRFDVNANDLDTVSKYFQNRAIQLLGAGEDIAWTGELETIEDWGVKTSLIRKTNEGETQVLHSVYVLNDFRGKGYYPKWILKNNDKIIFTVPDCDLEAFLKSKGILHVVGRRPDFIEYKWIEKEYGNKKARRSGVHLINHIDEGLWILKLIGANELAMRAYALHPLLQADPDLQSFWANEEKMLHVDHRVLILAMEYRNTANNYLSFMPSNPNIKLSPLNEVNQMLIADKIQNRKDFERYHKGTHPRSDRLVEYFSEWLHALGISEEQYQTVKNDILKRVGDKIE